MRLAPGTVLGPYEISDAIGAGGMGEVYRARDTRLGREVALKILPHEVSGDPERLARFEREARSSSALNHPNIVTVHDFTSAHDECYLVMELIRGESLRDLISRGPVAMKRLLPIATGIADGLAAAHDAGIVHRDLKPENVMLTAEGIPKILDFGLVKPAATMSHDSPTEAKVTSSGVILGTLTYMSPEQARGEPLGMSSDQFSLGVILYELATGRHPFRRANGYETVSAIISDEPAPLEDAVPAPFAWIIERCLAKDPAERYASTRDLARDLAAVRDRAGILKSGTATAAKPKRTFALVAVLVTAAVTGLALFAIFSAMRQRAPAGVSGPLMAAIPTGELEPHLDEVAVPVAISPDGRHLLVYGTGAKSSGELWVRDLRTAEMRLIAENAFAGSWSDDGSAIAFFADGKLKTIAVGGGPARVVCDARPESTPSWHGDTILYVQFSGGPARAGVYRVDAGGGVPKRLLAMKADGGLPWWPKFLPDGKRFLYMTVVTVRGGKEVGHELMVGSLDGSPPKSIGAIDSRAIFSNGHLLYVRDGVLLAQPFDADEARFTGEPQPLVDDLHYFRSTGMAAFDVSSNGVLAWRTARQPTRLAWLDRAGVELESIATALFDDTGNLSRDGNRYAVGVSEKDQGVTDVWIYDLNRGNGERVTAELLDQKAPVWAHDDQTIYYRSDGYGGPPDILALRPGQPPTTLHIGPGVEEPEDVSPDGRSLLFATFHPTSADIHVLPLDPPGPPRPFANTQFNELSPRFSPDGKWVAYVSNISGRLEVYVRPFEGAGPASRISRDGGTDPRWSRDGKELFFLGPAGRLMTVPIDRSFGAPRMLLQAANAISFEPSHDGSRFLVHLEQENRKPDVQLMINWPARLKPSSVR